MTVIYESVIAALFKIADTPCGVPGHAVAVGCGSSQIAAAELYRLGEELPERWQGVSPAEACGVSKQEWRKVGGDFMEAWRAYCELPWVHDGDHQFGEFRPVLRPLTKEPT